MQIEKEKVERVLQCSFSESPAGPHGEAPGPARKKERRRGNCAQLLYLVPTGRAGKQGKRV